MNKVRCAIYTRKSSEEGLEQGFNSLDAQREACAAYVLSQASEGWNLLPEIYDDGGISGGTLQRPALQRLLADVAAGRIDIIVVYKVDRLTRSLLDFSKLVEAFDKAGTSFVSITQSFNTTTSMGRLTLNMLLSFAQFEREVTAERIRDKISASKAKGMWMGGTPPLGYRPDGRTLAIVEEHAEVVRDIYQRYLATGNVRMVAEQLAAERIQTPQRTSATGRSFGACTFSRGQIYKILSNALYVGLIPHQGKLHKGQHAPIIARDVWDAVQAMLADNTQGGKRLRSPNVSLLASIIVDGTGEPMLATHAVKRGVRYRYYVSRTLHHGDGAEGQGLRLPAREIEALVKEQVAQTFDDPLMLAAQLSLEISPHLLRQITERCRDVAGELRQRSSGPLRDLVSQVRVREGRVEVDLETAGVAEAIGVDGTSGEKLTLCADFQLTRTGRAIRLIQKDGSLAAPVDANASLVNLVVLAHRWWKLLAEGEMDVSELAEQEGVGRPYICRVVKIAFLSPQVIEAILNGSQHGKLESGILRRPDAIAPNWEVQACTFLPGPSRVMS